jgi:hypothetical protein
MPMVKAGETDPLRRAVEFFLVAADGLSPATGEAGGQPQVSIDRGAFADAGIGVLVDQGEGWYYAYLDAATIATAGTLIATRYKSASTAMCPGESFQVTGFDPAATALTATLAPTGLDDVEVEAGLNGRQALSFAAAGAVGKISGAESYEITLKGVGVSDTRALVTVDEFGNRIAVVLSPPA